ncbi:MAG: epoxide hydrolase family protein [Gemmatimonadota bacterium]
MNRRSALASLLGLLGTAALRVRPPAAFATIRGPTGRAMRELVPYHIDIEPSLVDDLHRRIDAMRWPEIPFETGWSAGTNDVVLRELVDYWRDGYDWFRVQERMNALEHLRGPIQGDDIHCVRYEGAGPGPRLPIMLLHGWPSSFWEFHRSAERLASGADGTAFDVIVPSLPGFAFSDAPRRPGMNPTEIGRRLHALMLELGYDRYGVQGGDWGAIIGTQIARVFPESVAALHVNFVASAPPPPDGLESTAEEEAYRTQRARFSGEETGYSSIQGTRPQSLSYAQQDSPVGWLAWMLEKYWAWSDHGGDLWSVYDRDDLLTTAMLYWLPNRVLSAARIYYETSNQPRSVGFSGRVQVPTGYARFPAEPWAPPREVVERTYDLVHYSEHPRGGHFPALEQSERWSREVSGFFSRFT